MAKPQVTITLGRSGQKVVKELCGESGGDRATASAPSGSKRSLAEFFGSDADNLRSNNKRVREDVSSRSYGYNHHIDDPRIGPIDLRLKLTRKRISRQIELENERKKMELHEKVSRVIMSRESPDNLSRRIPGVRKAAETQPLGTTTSSFPSWTSNGPRQRSPERIPISSTGISTPRSAIDELPQISPMRSINSSRIERVSMNNPLESSRTKVPMLSTARRPLDSGMLFPEPPQATGGMSGSPYQDKQPFTVSSLLHSLGLGKYSINFQVEEIDVVALKQMGDSDLKELGVPMGPRKKILQALQAHMKRPLIQAPRIMLS